MRDHELELLVPGTRGRRHVISAAQAGHLDPVNWPLPFMLVLVSVDSDDHFICAMTCWYWACGRWLSISAIARISGRIRLAIERMHN